MEALFDEKGVESTRAEGGERGGERGSVIDFEMGIHLERSLREGGAVCVSVD